MYIRVKRKKLTIFLQVEPTDTVLEVKQKLQSLTEQVSFSAACQGKQRITCVCINVAAVQFAATGLPM